MDKVFIVSRPPAVFRALQTLRAAPIVGFDTETRPKFSRGGDAHLPALVQLATPSVAYLFPVHLWPLGDARTSALVALLNAPRPLKAGVNVDGDLRGLLVRLPSLRPAGFLRLEALATAAGVHARGLDALAGAVIDARLPKSRAVTLSNWEQWPLSEQQVHYAGCDAWAGAAIAQRLVDTLDITVEQLVATNVAGALSPSQTLLNDIATLEHSEEAVPTVAEVAAASVDSDATPDEIRRAKATARRRFQRRRKTRQQTLRKELADCSDEELVQKLVDINGVRPPEGVELSLLDQVVKAIMINEKIV